MAEEEGAEARSDLLVTRIGVLRDAVRQTCARAPFRIDAWVVLPDHMHCLWTLPEGDPDFAGRWRAIKIAFVKSLPAGEPRSAVMSRRGERGIWQRRYWEHTIRDDRDLAAHLDYIHFNPGPRALSHWVAWRQPRAARNRRTPVSASGTHRRGCEAECAARLGKKLSQPLSRKGQTHWRKREGWTGASRDPGQPK